MRKRRPWRLSQLFEATPAALAGAHCHVLILDGFKLEWEAGAGSAQPKPAQIWLRHPRGACLPVLGGGAADHVAVFTSLSARVVPAPVPHWLAC